MSRVLAGSAAVAAFLAGVLAWEAQGPAPPGPVTPRRPVAPGASADLPSSDADGAAAGWMDTALARPLFSGDRRPPRSATDPSPAQAAATRLAGVVTGPFGSRAIFVSAGSAKPVVLEEGARIGGLVIRSIEPGRVVVEADGAVRTLMPAYAAGEGAGGLVTKTP